MPWTTGDVDRFKSGLTQAQKRRWVSIANGVLRQCQQSNETGCEARAMRTANSRVGTTNNNNMEPQSLIQVNYNQSGYQMRTETLDGKNYIVMPVVMMVEGVHAGSAGPLLHEAEEFGNDPSSWEGIPVTVPHPERNGQYVSVFSDGVEEEFSVGTVYNARVEDGKLKAEAWLDEQRLIARSPQALNHIRNNQPFDVSIGVFTEDEQQEGDWNGEHYIAVSRNHRPDHLALLPGERGACSLDDGCGIGINKKGGNEVPNTKKDDGSQKKNFVNHSSKKGDFVIPVLVNQGTDYQELVHDLSAKLDGWDNEDRIHYLRAVYDDHLIYEMRSRATGGNRFYKQEYEANEEDGTVEFVGQAQQVMQKVEYVPLQNNRMTRTRHNNKKKEDSKMANNKKEGCCEEKVDKLIAHKSTKYTKEDREYLLGLEERIIDDLMPSEEPVKKQESKKTTDPQINADQIKEIMKESMKSPDDFLNFVPDQYRDQMENGLRLHKEKRQVLISQIQNNTEKDLWTEEELNAMSTERLEKFAKSVTKDDQMDYSGLGNPNFEKEVQANKEEKVLLPTGLGVNKEKQNK
jgi:hypothetical protein